MEKLAVRKPVSADLPETFKDMATLRTAPPLIVSAASVFFITGSPLFALAAVGITSFVHAFWARLLNDHNPEVR